MKAEHQADNRTEKRMETWTFMGENLEFWVQSLAHIIEKLNESGGSDRLSFVKQLENMFCTPAKIDLWYDFDLQLSVLPVLPGMDTFATMNDGDEDFWGYLP
ncbi:uncharacterized protein EDB91DRAFT_1252010 [Suillus paluster]|uniref:uncharacterized protein n=1 Tax=Suillus paluster TaxID=48578 RepID=UPI001B87BA1D|nr:uncharacterized protein EDB91DRAFT_1252010 [Suillus paluster]KAG1731852.1 hypothetical protein EDB91DRAFT_1252010 [Suillus paluster]